MRNVLLLYLICSSVELFSQGQTEVDSLCYVLEMADARKEFLALYEQTFRYAQSDNEMALQLIQQAEAIALKTGDTLWIVKSKRVKGQLLYFLERLTEAENVLNEVRLIAQRNQLDWERFYIEQTLGNSKLLRGHYDKALQWDFRMLELANRLSDTVAISTAFNSIAIAYYKLKDYEKALDYYLRAFILSDLFKPEERSHIQANIGLCYAHLGCPSEARQFALRSLENCGPHCSDRARVNLEYTFGVIAFCENDYFLAERHFMQSYSIAKKSHNIRFQLDNIYMIADIKMKQARYSEAEAFLREAEKLIDRDTPFKLEIIKILSSFSRLYMDMKKFEKAAYYQYEYISLKDSIYSEELTTSLMDTEAEYLERENRNTIAAQQEVIQLKEEIIDKQSTLNRMILLLALIGLICAVSLLRNYRQRKIMNRLLNNKVEERTRELQLKQDQLVRSFHEHQLIIERASSGVSETLKTIRGLCSNAQKDVSDPVAVSYIKRIDSTSKRLNDLLKRDV